MKNSISLLSNKFPKYIKNFGITEIFEIDGELHTTSEYNLPFTIIELFKNEIKKSKVVIKQFYFENGVSGGYYVVDSNGINWAVQDTKELALSWYNRLNETNIKLTK